MLKRRKNNYIKVYFLIIFIFSIIFNLSVLSLEDSFNFNFYSNDSIPIFEDSCAFSIPDFIFLSLNDFSYIITSWFFNGSKIDNPLFIGSFIFFPILNFLNIKSINFNNIYLDFNFNKKSTLYFSYNFGINSFDMIVGPYLYDFVNSLNIDSFLLGLHPLQREKLPFPSRRHIRYQFIYDFFINFNDFINRFYNNSNSNNKNIYGNNDQNINLFNFLNILYIKGERSFNSFYFDENKNFSYFENFYILQFIGNLNFFNNSDLNPLFIIEKRYLSNFYNQYGFQFEQTAKLDHFVIGLFNIYYNNYEELKNENVENENFETIQSNEKKFLYSFYFIKDIIQHNDIDFSFDIYDPDGEGLFPLYPDGVFNIIKIDLNNINIANFKNIFENDNLISNLNIYFDLSLNNYYYNKNNDFWENLVYFKNDLYGKVKNYSGNQFFINHVYNINFESTSILFSNINILFNSGVNFNLYLNDRFVNTLFLASPFFDLKISGLNSESFIYPYIKIYKKNVLLNYQYIKYLNPDFYNIYIYQKDLSGDYILIDTQGGKFTKVDSNLKLPSIYGLEAGFDINISKNFKFNLTLGGYILFNKFILIFDKNYDNYLYSENIDGFDVYFLKEGEKYYVFKNNKSNYKDYSVFLKFSFEYNLKDKFFFDISFKMYQTLGITTFGNGFTNNDLLSLDYSFSNPNTYTSFKDKTSYGRTYDDRAYNFNFKIGYSIFNDFKIFLMINYLDGQPFAFYKIFKSSSGQIALIYDTIQAENYLGIKGGPREDSIWKIHLKIEIKDIFIITVYNLIDIGNELGENQFSFSRSSLELNFPITFEIELNINL
jgi:hypothetical protein